MGDFFLGSEDYDGLLLYVVHNGLDQTTIQVIEAAEQVFENYGTHPIASPYGVGATNVAEFPDAEILAQIEIDRFPTLLFVKVEDNQMTGLFNRFSGGVSYNKIKREFVRLLEIGDIEIEGVGAGAGEGWFEQRNENGIGLGLGNLFGFNCYRYLPDWFCGFPILLFVLLLVILSLFTLKLVQK